MRNAKKQEEKTKGSIAETSEEEKDHRPVCGLIMPIADTEGYPAGHWDELKRLYISVGEDAGFRTRLVSDSDDVRIIQKNIVQNVFDDDIVICDVSSKNPNVMFELGLRLAFDKAAVIVKDNVTGYSFDTSPIAHINYRKDLRYYDIEDFKAELKGKLEATFKESQKQNHSMYLDSFGKFVVKDIKINEVSNDEFIIESLKQIKVDLSNLKLQNKSEKSTEILEPLPHIDQINYYKIDKLFPQYLETMPDGEFISAGGFFKYIKDRLKGSSNPLPTYSMVSQYFKHNTV